MRNPQDNLKTYWLRQLEHADGKQNYCKVASSNTSRVEAHEDFLRLFIKGNFDPYVL